MGARAPLCTNFQPPSDCVRQVEALAASCHEGYLETAQVLPSQEIQRFLNSHEEKFACVRNSRPWQTILEHTGYRLLPAEEQARLSEFGLSLDKFAPSPGQVDRPSNIDYPKPI